MLFNRYFLIFTLTFLFIYRSSFGQLKLETYALEGVTIIDANNKKPLTNQTIIISGDTIFKIFPTNSIKLPDSITVLKLKGKYVVPGLIDSHIHLLSNRDERPKTESKLKEMLFSGITSCRDMANDARTISSLSKDALVGDLISPNIYYSALMAGPKYFIKDPRPPFFSMGGVLGQMPYMRVITDTTNLALAVAEAKGCGASGIKLYQYLSPNLVSKVVIEANKQNIKVWSHAYLYPAKPEEIINSGITTISHSEMLIRNYLDTIPRAWKKDTTFSFWEEKLKNLPFENLFTLMKKKDVILDATLLANSELPEDATNFVIAKIMTRKAYVSGVKISTGTDSQDKLLIEEIRLLKENCSFSNYDLIVSATKYGAEALGILKSHGTIEVGKYADLLILNSNPLEDINNLEAVNFVIKAGTIYKR
jgi:imidazolonepropionase-like amidohydrolase